MPISQENIEVAIELAKEYGATKLLLFGSTLNNPQNANDLDLAAEGIAPSKLLLFGAELEDIILKNVDIIPLDSNSIFVKHIVKYGKYIYEKTNTN